MSDSEWDGVERRNTPPPMGSVVSWVQVIFVIIGVAVTMYVLQQQHEYRLTALEQSYFNHIQKHEETIQEIRNSINAIRVDIARLNPETMPFRALK